MDELPKKILMICYYYPPLTDVGCKRSVAFSKYFKKYGWQPYVLSVKNPDKTYCSLGNDRPPDGVVTYYSYSLFNTYKILGKLNGALSRLLAIFKIEVNKNYFIDFLCYPDLFFGWIPLTIFKALSIIKQNKIDIIYVSCSPFSSAVVGVLLKMITKKPLVLDFRDPFAIEGVSFKNIPNFRKAIDRTFEKFFLKHADLFIVTSEETRQEYIKQYPEIIGKAYTIYNGFDPVPFDNKDVQKFDKFTIIYTGQFYLFGPHHNEYTDLFFHALNHLKSTGEIRRDNFQFLFYGSEYIEIGEIARRYGVEDLVSANSRVAYRDILHYIKKSHLMLLRIVKLMISTKLFEGIPMNVPFLATIPHGEVEDIIRTYSLGSYLINEKNTYMDVVTSIQNAIGKYKSSNIQENDVYGFLAKFKREDITLNLIRIITQKIINRNNI